jgi:EAL domain-containing protein (putative c-di-GMP-specific phosphodiesterase class I)
VSDLLTKVKPQESTLYRFCSDRFVIVDDRNLTQEDVIRVAESILSFFSYSEIALDDDIELRISFSIGISREKGLINITQAEVAIRELRESKRNDFKLFDPSSRFVHNEQENIYWIQKISESISEEGIVAYFQPIVNNKTGKIEKYECLARLRDNDEIISPYLFMDSAKVTGNLSYVTKSLITQSFKKFSSNNYEFSINITGEDLALDYLESYLLKNVNKYKINPSRVVLEMLEDITTLDKGTTQRQISSLRENGFKIAIDDFGAENSNLSRLLEINPDYLKIDGAFIKNIVDDEKSQIIVDAIIMICERSGIKIIAEYIHNEQVQERVKSLGIEFSQGYYFGEPNFELVAQ